METHKNRVLTVTAKDFLLGDDGYYVFWPKAGGGAYIALDLRVIADELDSRNAVWNKIVGELHKEGITNGLCVADADAAIGKENGNG